MRAPLDPLPHLPEDLLADSRRGQRPRPEGALRRLDRPIDVDGIAGRDPGEHLVSGGVAQRDGLPAVSVDPFAVDELSVVVAERGQRRG